MYECMKCMQSILATSNLVPTVGYVTREDEEQKSSLSSAKRRIYS